MEKAPGYDNVHAYVLVNTASSLAIPLSTILNNSLSTGKVPQQWVLANVTPIHKKGSKLDPNNYRPVSLTSIICKILEKFVKAAIMNHMKRNKLICEQQHGFVDNKSCVTNLLESVETITWHMWKHEPLDILFLDFAKAFDSVPHKRLLMKLKAYGISEQIVAWVRAFLSSRRQRVIRGENISEWVEVSSGVPQGSIIGPILFVLYINDLPDSLESMVKIFADDSKLLSKVNKSKNLDKNNNVNLIQNDLDKIAKWSQKWLLNLNERKCKCMHIGRENPKIRYHLNNVEIEETTIERDLGVLISNDLKWKQRCTLVAQKANRLLGILKRTFSSRDLLLWKRLYTTYVRPLLEYAASIWCPYAEGDINKIEKVQRRATKIPYETREKPYQVRCLLLGIQQLEARRTRGDLIQFFKIEKSLDIVNWTNKPIRIEGRGEKRPQIRRDIVHHGLQRHHFFYNRIADTWNGLSDELVNSPTVNSFKINLDKLIDA